MDDQKQRYHIEPYDGVMLEVLKAAFQASTKPEFLDERLDDDQSGKGGQPLILESKLFLAIDSFR